VRTTAPAEDDDAESDADHKRARLEIPA